MIGRVIGPYEILSEIGRGGMGVVYEARDRRLDRRVAVKAVRPEMLGDAAARARFEREARAASQLQHPFIAHVLDVLDDEGQELIVMEKVEGERLDHRLQKGSLPVEQAVSIAEGVASALREAHERGLVHRDVKPGNIVLTRSGHVKVLDFGLVRRMPVDAAATISDATMAGAVVGTIGYMSPEQARGEDAGPQSDVFSLGAVLYEMLTGRRPFAGDHMGAWFYALFHDTPSTVSSLRPEVPEALGALVAAMLARDPATRPASAGEVIERLRVSGRAGAPAPPAPAGGERRIRAVVVDDEAPARGLMREYLAAHADIEVVGECMNGFEAVKRIGELEPDVAFLDVQMPKLDGFEVLELLDRPPVVVFVTAYDEHALRAFEVHAVDYVLKPVGRERLAAALDQVRARLSSLKSAAPPTAVAAPSAVALAAAARPPGQFVERLLVKDGANVHVIPVDRLDYLEAQDDYIAIHSEGKTYLKPQTMAELTSGLDPNRFVRVHRSYLLNVERLARLELYAKDSRVAILKSGKELPVSRAGYARLKELM